MKTVALLLLLIAVSQAFDHHVKKTPSARQFVPPPGENDSSKRSHEGPHVYITGGQVATRGDYPWVTLIIMDNAYQCGGSLISDEWILTAAQCTYGFAKFVIYLGAQNWQDDEVDRLIVDTTNRIAHGDFNPSNFQNDIALIKLRSRIGLNNYIQTVKLPPRSMQNNDFAGTNATAVGWGVTADNDTSFSTDLRYVVLTVITDDQCKATWGSTVTPGNLCTDASQGKSTCTGDNGGPLTTDDKTIIGIQTFTSSAGCQQHIPSVFTRVTHYLDWIGDNACITIQN